MTTEHPEDSFDLRLFKPDGRIVTILRMPRGTVDARARRVDL
jgi:hypothetical protein